MKVLSVLANPRSVEDSACLKIERAFCEALAKQHPGAVFDKIDVYRDEIPLLDEKLLRVFWGAKPEDEETYRRMKRREEILSQFMGADLIIIATPMWNFSTPPMLKAYIDTILISGKTFEFTEVGPRGLLKNKKAVLCIASGGVYEGPMAAYDHLAPVLKTQLGFIGITDVTVIWAAAQGMGAELATANLKAALEKAVSVAGAI